MADAVLACAEAHRPRADSKRITLDVQPPDDDDSIRVRADPEGLRVILGNLVDNAIKYTPEGGRVVIRWGPPSDTRPPMVRVEVADNGVGIPKEKLGRVFERFYRVDESRTRGLGGAGLGLAIVKHFAQSFGGVVAVQSTPESGTTFSVSLPAA